MTAILDLTRNGRSEDDDDDDEEEEEDTSGFSGDDMSSSSSLSHTRCAASRAVSTCIASSRMHVRPSGDASKVSKAPLFSIY